MGKIQELTLWCFFLDLNRRPSFPGPGYQLNEQSSRGRGHNGATQPSMYSENGGRRLGDGGTFQTSGYGPGINPTTQGQGSMYTGQQPSSQPGLMSGTNNSNPMEEFDRYNRDQSGSGNARLSMGPGPSGSPSDNQGDSIQLNQLQGGVTEEKFNITLESLMSGNGQDSGQNESNTIIQKYSNKDGGSLLSAMTEYQKQRKSG